MKATDTFVHVETDAPLAVLTIDRPDALNAVDENVLGQLEDALDELEADGSVRVLIVTGTGKAFVAGGDIAAMQRMTVAEGERFVRRGHDLLLRLERSRLVVLAAINGYALGGGTEIALACDLRIASERASFGLPETTIGLFPGWGGTQRLLRLCGLGIAKDLVLTGRRIDAAEALRIRLVEHVVPADGLLDAARDLGRQIAANGPVAVSQAKKALNQGAQMALDQAIALEIEAWLVNFGSADRVEGLLAFLEKRKPQFSGG